MSDGSSEGTAPRFEDTLDVLEQQREETESRYRELLDALERAVAELRDAAQEALEIHAQEVAGREAGLGALGEKPPDKERTPWPGGVGVLRRSLNRFSAWLMRDFLEVMDRRADEMTERIGALGSAIGGVREASTASTRSAELLCRATRSAAEALDAAAAVEREMLDLVNAKDAEVLQRAVAGPLRRMEIVFDEFGRQQEALLAELVGKRQELDELLDRAVSSQNETANSDS